MENKIMVTVYIYYGDDQSKHSDYLYNCFRARRNDCNSIYNSLVDSPFVCACRSSKNYSGDTMVFRLSCPNKDAALKVFEKIEGLNATEAEEKYRVIVNIYYKYYSTSTTNTNDDTCSLQFFDKLSADNFYKIAAFLKDSSLVAQHIDIEDFNGIKVITVKCSDEKNALTILHGLDGCIKTEIKEDSAHKNNSKSVNEEDNAPKNNSISSEIDYIAKNLDDTDLFLQLAEEAAELSQSCLKYVRAHKGNNPTKDSEEVYLKNILEELTDVRVSADVLNIEEDIDTYINKIHRWADRIRCKNGVETK